MQSLRCFLREALVGFWRARAMNAITVAIIGAALAILGGFLLLAENIRIVAGDWDRLQVNAYLKDDAVDYGSPDLEALLADVASRPAVSDVRFVSREEAMDLFRSRFSDLADAAAMLGANPFPASIEITLRGEPGERPPGTDDLLAGLRASPLVEMVQDNEEESRRLRVFLGIVFAVGLGVGGVLAAASVFIIYNVIRLTVQSRRDEIAIMRLVGATSGFIRGPFLVEGMLQGGVGALLAIGALWAAYLGMTDYAARSGSGLAAVLSSRFLPASTALGLALGGLLIGLAGSALSLRRFLTR